METKTVTVKIDVKNTDEMIEKANQLITHIEELEKRTTALEMLVQELSDPEKFKETCLGAVVQSLNEVKLL